MHHYVCFYTRPLADVVCVYVCVMAVRQFADICLFSTAQYKCTVAELDSE